ncbi:MAG: hypothetical protein JWL61_5425 [Gemmatimonadetes bacterium]|nr:hypothetical protein [Gemmatimonadota bacterium]
MIAGPEVPTVVPPTITFATYVPTEHLAGLTGFKAFRALQDERLTPYEVHRLTHLFRRIEACNIPYGIAFILALTGPVFAVGPKHINGPLAALGEAVALIWFAAAFDPGFRENWMIVRWPGTTTLVCAGGALAVVLSHGQGGVAVWLLCWALPGLVQSFRYVTASHALRLLVGVRRKVTELAATP